MTANTNQPQESGAPVQSFTIVPAGFSIDLKRIGYQALRFWYIVVLSVVIAMTVAWLRNRYATRIYPVTASIIIQEKEETSEGKLLYNNPIVSGFRNYLNELYLMRSYPMVERTISSLHFESAFYRVGNFLTSEAYKYLPVEVRVVDDKNSGGRQFYFEVLDNDRFQLTTNFESGDQQSGEFRFGETFEFQNLKATFSRKGNADVERFKGESLLFTYTPIQWLTGSYVGKLNVGWAEEGAGIVNISVSGPNPAKDIDFINGLINEYQQYDLTKKNLVATRTIDFISEQLDIISDSLRKAERKLEVFKNKNVVSNMSLEAQRLYEKIEGLEVQKTELLVRENYYKYLEDYLTDSNSLDQVMLPTSIGVNDPILGKLLQDLLDEQTQLKMYKGSLENPFVRERRQKIGDIKKNVIEALQNQKSVDNIKMEFLQKEIGLLDKQMRSLPFAERELVSMQRSYSLLENLYVFLQQKRAEASISKAATTTDIQVINPPMSGGPISPKTQQNFIIALVIGLGIPLALFILMELTNTRVQSREDVERLTTIPFIGGIGHKKGERNTEVLQSPRSSIAESFRALRSNLNYFTGNRTKATFMITSSISGEGKTFTSINLASVLVLAGQKVLIVGADLRKPRLFSDFELTNTLGLSSYLSGMATFDEVVQQTKFENLSLVSGGPVPPNPSELLLNKRMTDFMALAKERFDYIILDTPPIAIVTDALALADFADHALFVVRQNHTPKILLKNIDDFHKSGKLKNISLVLNDIYRSGPGYGYGYGYGGYGYGYGYGYVYGRGKKSKNGYGYYTES